LVSSKLESTVQEPDSGSLVLKCSLFTNVLVTSFQGRSVVAVFKAIPPRITELCASKF